MRKQTQMKVYTFVMSCRFQDEYSIKRVKQEVQEKLSSQFDIDRTAVSINHVKYVVGDIDSEIRFSITADVEDTLVDVLQSKCVKAFNSNSIIAVKSGDVSCVDITEQ